MVKADWQRRQRMVSQVRASSSARPTLLEARQ
jgi:hypothetical protein